MKAIINGSPRWQLRHITGSPTGNRAQNDLRVHFGLGDAELIDSLIIEWPLGLKEIFTSLPANQFLNYIEGETTALEEVSASSDSLLQIYPNPFSASINIDLNLIESKQIKLSILNVLGQEIKLVLNEKMNAGLHQLSWDGRNEIGRKVPPGIYFVRIKSNNYKIIRKIVGY